MPNIRMGEESAMSQERTEKLSQAPRAHPLALLHKGMLKPHNEKEISNT